MDYDQLFEIANNFDFENQISYIEPIKTGNINSTFLVASSDGKQKFILQKLSDIFIDHRSLTDNHKLITDFIGQQLLLKKEANIFRRWELPILIKLRSSNSYLFRSEGSSWRAMKYIDCLDSKCLIMNSDFFYDIGHALGSFHFILSGFNANKLTPNLPHFHDTNFYFDQFNSLDKFFDSNDLKRLDFQERVNKLVDIVISNSERVKSFIFESNQGLIKKEVVHGDPKLSNFLFSRETSKVIALIDLDTVSIGFRLNDLADCIRSSCKKTSKNVSNNELLDFDLNTCFYLLEGYLEASRGLYAKKELLYLPEFIYQINFELGLRFLNDFLDSNKYFKTEYFSQNLVRAEEQFSLMDSVIKQWEELQELVQNLTEKFD